MAGTVDIHAPVEQAEGTRSRVLRWLKPPGAVVAEHEPLVELETDKVTVEVAAPASGVLSEIVHAADAEVAPGEILGRIDTGAAPAVPPREPAVRPAVATAMAAPVTTAAAEPHEVTRVARGSIASPPSPAVRRLLAEHGLDAESVRGSGPHGRITVEDVLRAASDGDPGPAAPAAPVPDGDVAHEPQQPVGGVRRIAHTAVRRRIAQHMVKSLHTAPHVTTVFEADLGAVLEDRERRREALASQGVPLTLTAYFARAAVAAIRAVPEANSRWTEDALEVYEAVHLGVATAVPGYGLLVPVLRNAQALDLAGTAAGLHDLVSRARSGGLAPAEVRGGTFTISNHGVSGSLLAAPIVIAQPQSAILGIGRLERRAVVIGEGGGERIGVRPRCYVTLTIDHRVMDGEQANQFLRAFVSTLGNWSGSGP